LEILDPEDDTMPERDKISEENCLWREAPKFRLGSGYAPGAHPLTAAILGERGLDIGGRSETFLRKSLKFLADPSDLADSQRATLRILEAIEHDESIVVYGDYDVDGVCSSALLVENIRKLGGTIDFYIPDRRIEGYGIHREALEHLADKHRLMITTDCGITAVDELQYAADLGLDVVVVDHHQLAPEMPNAVACLNPHRPDCKYPYSELCATGVAFLLAVSLRREARERGWFQNRAEPDLRQSLDLVALATVADMVPLQSVNRIFVASGLQQLAKAERPGMSALMEVSRVEPTKIDSSDLGFKLGPRINARGRLAHAGLAVDLMLTKSPTDALQWATLLDQANLRRREIEAETVDEAKEQIHERSELQNVLVVHNETWHPGVIGLVAAKLVREWNRPAIVIGEGGKGSARSIPSVDIHAAMGKAGHLLEKFGGHKAAAGLTIQIDRIEDFAASVSDAVSEQVGNAPYQKEFSPDLDIDVREVDLGWTDALETLSPFGMGNPQPLFFASNVPVIDSRVVGKSHLKLQLGTNAIDAIGFGMGDHAEHLATHIDILFTIERNSFRGKTTVQLKLESLRSSEGS